MLNLARWTLVLTILAGGGVQGARDSSCPRVCPAPTAPSSSTATTSTSFQAPVCGSDGIIYPSACELRRKNCGKDIRPEPESSDLCSAANESQCQHKCGKEKDYVCGNDGHTYLNACFLRVQTCRTGVTFSHAGPCNNISAHRENCPVSCDQAPDDGPVCGSNGNVYKNSCLMKKLTCGQGVVKTSKKNCQTTRHCRESCWRNAKPTCGSDGVIYSNACRMKSKNCGKHVFEVPMAYCLSQERTNGVQQQQIDDCPTSCPIPESKNSTVCGSDGLIYSSECELKLLNCGGSGNGSKRRVVKVDYEKCRGKLGKCSRIKCDDKEDQPVCGSDAKTYKSQCHLQVTTCLKGIQLAHIGHCTQMLEPENCPEECDDEQIAPVCGSDGNVYRSLCDLKRLTCGQKVVPVDLKFCPTTAGCNATCPDTPNYICASDNKFYRNPCTMKRDNCGKHVYEVPIKRCLAGFQFKGCQKICPTFFDPVCATDNKTYSNDCFLQLENCRSRSGLRKLHHGKCGQPQQAPPYNYLY